MTRELTLDDFQGIEREAAEAGVLAGTFVQQFTKFMQQAYPKLGLSGGQIAPMKSLLEELSLGIRETSEVPRQAFYQCCASEEEGVETRADVILTWRLDLQYPSMLSLSLPYLEYPLHAVFLKEKPTSTRSLRRLLACQIESQAQVQMHDDRFDVVQQIQSSERKYKFRSPFPYLGSFEQYHIYANNPQNNIAKEQLTLDMLHELRLW